MTNNNQKNNIVWAVFGALVLVLVMWAGFRNTVEGVVSKDAGVQTIKLGFMLPLTGQLGGIGESIQKAGIMAVEDYQRQNPNIKVEIVSEDDAFDVKKGIPAYNKLTELDKVDAIMMVSSPVVDAMYQEMRTDGLPVMSIGTQNTGVGQDNIFQLTLDSVGAIKDLAKFVENGDHKGVAVVYNSAITLPTRFHNTFVDNYKKDMASFAVNDPQMAKIVANKIVSDGFDAVVVLEDGIGGPHTVKNLLALDTQKKLKYYFDFQLASTLSEYKKILGDTNKLNGVHYLRLKQQDLSVYNEMYKTKFASDPLPFSEYGYDTAMLMLETYNKDKAVWANNIQNSTRKGFSGKLKLDSNGVNVQEVEIVQVENGEVK